MSCKQQFVGGMMLGKIIRHYTGRTGIVVGCVVGKKGKGLWLQAKDDIGTWCQYIRC